MPIILSLSENKSGLITERKEYPMKPEIQELKTRLREINCNEKLADQIVELLSTGDCETARLLLRRHRKQLMDELHESEKRVDDLDLLVYQIDRKKL